MKPEFYLILRDHSELTTELEDAVFEAGFDDSVLTIRGPHAAIEVFARDGEVGDVVRHAIGQAEAAGLIVSEVRLARTSFPPQPAAG